MRYGSSLVACLAFLALASRGEAGSRSDSGSKNPVIHQQMVLETEAQHGAAYDADDEGPTPEGNLPAPNERGMWPWERLYSGRAVRPAPFPRGTPAPGSVAVGRRENAPVSHRPGLAQPALRPPEESSLALAGLVRAADQPSNKGTNTPGALKATKETTGDVITCPHGQWKMPPSLHRTNWTVPADSRSEPSVVSPSPSSGKRSK